MNILKIIVTIAVLGSQNIQVDGILDLDGNLPCAAGISDIPPLNKLQLPRDRFPSKIPSGVNVCDASCRGRSICTYNWGDTLFGFPTLLFKCQCADLCPPLKMLYSGYLKINCKNVTHIKSKCKCEYGKTALRCSLQILPFEKKNPFYCVCCNAHIHTFIHIVPPISHEPHAEISNHLHHM